MAKNEEPRVTPERLMQFGFAYAPPLIIGGAVSKKVFDTLARGPAQNRLTMLAGRREPRPAGYARS